MDLIREMRDCDADRVMEIYRLGIEGGKSTFTSRCPDYSEWDKNHLSFCRYVYEKDGAVVGWIVLSPTSSREPYKGVCEVSVYVDGAYFRRGIGEALMKHLIENAPKNGVWSLYSAIFAVNEASIALHKKCGFRVVGYRERIAKDRFGNWQNTVIMEKRL